VLSNPSAFSLIQDVAEGFLFAYTRHYEFELYYDEDVIW